MSGVFEKVSEVRKLVRTVFPELDDSSLVGMVRVAAKWHYNKRSRLSNEHLKLYELLINNSYNPDTVYKWLLLSRSPFELRERIRNKLISQRAAFSKKKELNSLASTSNQELLQDIIQSVDRYIIR